jgi:ABC-2 type transport system permease protein
MNLLHRRPAGGAAHLRSVFERSLHDQRRALLGWMAGLALLAVWLMGMYPTIKNNKAMTDLLKSYPEPLRKLFQLDDFTSGPGYLRSEVFAFTVPVLFAIVAVLWGSDAIAGEEERHTLDLALANPITRRRFLLERWAAVTASLAGIGVAFGAVLSVATPLVGLDVAWTRLTAVIVACVLLAVVFATLALALGAATGHRGLARGVAVIAVVAAYLVSSLADLVSWLRPLRPFSPWHHALGVDPIRAGLSVLHVALLVSLVLALLVAAIALFERRDLIR